MTRFCALFWLITAFAAAESFVDVDGGKLYYEECGTGPSAVLLVHDGVAHSVVWDDVWPRFCAKFHTIRYDRRGYGKSPETKDWHFETDDIAALLRHLKISRVTIVGSSHGGEISIDYTLDHPTEVKGLVLIGAVVGGMGFTEHFIDRGQKTSGAESWANDPYLLAANHTAAKKRLAEILKANPQDVKGHGRILPTNPALPRLGEIHVPTLVLVGDADIPDVHAHAGAIETGIYGARRVVVNDAGHLMYMEQPEEFSKIVLRFIELNVP